MSKLYDVKREIADRLEWPLYDVTSFTEVVLKWLGVTQRHRQHNHSIERIRLFIRI